MSKKNPPITTSFSVRTYRRNLQRIKEGVAIALSNRLYVPGWVMSDSLRTVHQLKLGGLYFKDYLPDLLLIGFVDDVPVSCAWVQDGHIMLFVRVRYRRQGIGSKMYEKAMSTLGRKKRLVMDSWHSDAAQGFVNKQAKKYRR